MAQTPRKTTAPADIGCTIEPTMVAAKIAKRRHETGVIPSGAPTARMPDRLWPTRRPAPHQERRIGGACRFAGNRWY
jgi:hypothetical protein